MNNTTFKKIVIGLSFVLIISNIYSQEEVETWKFDTLINVKTTSVKNQYHSGTCWDFGTVSFIETELIRKGVGSYDLSEMYFVRKIYPSKARRFVLYHGTYNFAEGGQAHDVMNAIRTYGMLPESVYSGKNIGESKHDHSEMDAVLKAMMSAVVSKKGGQITPRWPDAIESVLDAYLGVVPEFTFNGKIITPKEYAKELGVNPDDYIELTSFSYYPFYKKCMLEIPDNWSMDTYYNLPIDDLMKVMFSALENGYSLVWDGDVSDKYFTHKNGVAFVPKVKWEKYSDEDLEDYLESYHQEVAEVTQGDRDKTIYNQTTTDDHLMHLVGLTKDQFGNKYFLTKNSWSKESNKFGGYLNTSEKYIRLRTIAIMVHKDAIPKDIAKKIGLK